MDTRPIDTRGARAVNIPAWPTHPDTGLVKCTLRLNHLDLRPADVSLEQRRGDCAGGYWMPGEQEWVEAMDSVTLDVDPSTTVGQLMERVQREVEERLAAVVVAAPQHLPHSCDRNTTILAWLGSAGDRPTIELRRSKRDVSR